MLVRVRLYGHLKNYAAGSSDIEFDLPAGSTAEQVVNSMAVPPGEVGMLLVNGRLAERGAVLPSDARIEVLPVITGG